MFDLSRRALYLGLAVVEHVDDLLVDRPRHRVTMFRLLVHPRLPRPPGRGTKQATNLGSRHAQALSSPPPSPCQEARS